MNKMEKIGNISFHSFVRIDDSIYFSALNCNGLYKYDMNSGVTEYMGAFPLENKNVRHLHGMVKYIDGKIYFVPMFGKYLSIYDIREKAFDTIKLGLMDDDKSYYRYYDAIPYNDLLLLIPGRASKIISINIKNGELQYIDEWKKLIPNEEKPTFKNGSFEYEGSIYIPCCNTNCLLRINTSNISDVELVRIGNYEYGFTDAIFYPEEKYVLLLSSSKTAIIKYALNTNNYEEYSVEDDSSEVMYPHIKMLEIGEKILILAYQRKNSILFDKETCKFSQFDLEKDLRVGEWGAYHYSMNRISENEVLIINTNDYSLYLVDEKYSIRKVGVYDNQIINHKITDSKNMVLKEDSEITLSDYIEFLNG